MMADTDFLKKLKEFDKVGALVIDHQKVIRMIQVEIEPFQLGLILS